MARILVVDDENAMRFTMREILRGEGHDVDEAENGDMAVSLYSQAPYDLVVMDYKMPHTSGIEALRQMVSFDPQVVVIMVTALADRQIGVDAVQHGAFDFFCKPFNVDEMRVVVRRGLERRRLMKTVSHMSQQLQQDRDKITIIGNSGRMKNVLSMVDRVGNTDVTVLVLGESGTGKELIARRIHSISPRSNGPFVAVNCSAIPETLLESELFGYEKGAFTGADQQHQGRFEQAQHGTLFLDEIGDMNLQMQVKMLRALEEHEITRVGGKQNISTDIRVIAATNRNLEQAVERGEFREDLYYRLNVVTVALPALREREQDVPLLVDYFLQSCNAQFGTNLRGVADDALDLMQQYEWPGNVRELENVIQRATVLADGPFITRNDLPESVIRSERRKPVETESEDTAVDSLTEKAAQAQAEVEKEEILRALNACRWKRGEAAEMLGINRRSLLRKMKRYDLC